jgi:hypothetical protein
MCIQKASTAFFRTQSTDTKKIQKSEQNYPVNNHYQLQLGIILNQDKTQFPSKTSPEYSFSKH